MMTKQEKNAARVADRLARPEYYRQREKNWRRKRKGLPPLPLAAPAVTTIQEDIDLLQQKISQQTGMHAVLTITVTAL